MMYAEKCVWLTVGVNRAPWRCVPSPKCADVELFSLSTLSKEEWKGVRPRSPQGLETSGQEQLNAVFNGLE